MSLPDSGLLGYGLDQSGFSRVLQKDFPPSFPFRGRGSRGPGEGDCRHPLTLRGGAFDIIFLPEGPDVACRQKLLSKILKANGMDDST